VRVLVFGSDKPGARAVVDWLFQDERMHGLLILTNTGLASYAWMLAGNMAKDRTQFWLDRFSHKADAMVVAIEQMMKVGKPDVALCVSPRANDDKTVKLLRASGCTVFYGKLDAARAVSWVPA
tara:strand:+ start:42803 stop:43171 length:369 start_codon:yes stop_codon:yes gene_type:complete